MMRRFNEVVESTEAGKAWTREPFGFEMSERRFAVEDAYCDNVDCDGLEVDIRLVPETGSESQAVEFRLDLGDGVLSYPSKSAATLEAQAAAAEFASCRATYRLLLRHRQIVRGWALAESRKTKALDDDPFPLRAFDAFDPGGEEFLIPFEVEGRIWLARDSYCVNPKCPCEPEAVLSFGRGIREDAKAIGPEIPVRLKLASGKASGEGEKSLPSEEERLVQSFKTAVPSWAGELAVRRELLRRMGARCLFREPEVPTRVAPIVGRNAPCPCGSGKKYKKCCGKDQAV